MMDNMTPSKLNERAKKVAEFIKWIKKFGIDIDSVGNFINENHDLSNEDFKIKFSGQYQDKLEFAYILKAEKKMDIKVEPSKNVGNEDGYGLILDDLYPYKNQGAGWGTEFYYEPGNGRGNYGYSHSPGQGQIDTYGDSFKDGHGNFYLYAKYGINYCFGNGEAKDG